MRLARVVGTVVCTVKNEALAGKTILMLRALDRDGVPGGEIIIGLDAIGAGVGEDVFYSRGKEGALPWHPQPVPSDCSITGILDRYNFERGKKGL